MPNSMNKAAMKPTRPAKSRMKSESTAYPYAAMAWNIPSKAKPNNIDSQGLPNRMPRYVDKSSTHSPAVVISTTAVSVLTRADSKFKSNESMKGKVLSDAYLEFIVVNKVCEQWNLNRGFRPFLVCVGQLVRTHRLPPTTSYDVRTTRLSYT
jgi:hypothetical protein